MSASSRSTLGDLLGAGRLASFEMTTINKQVNKENV